MATVQRSNPNILLQAGRSTFDISPGLAALERGAVRSQQERQAEAEVERKRQEREAEIKRQEPIEKLRLERAQQQIQEGELTIQDKALENIMKGSASIGVSISPNLSVGDLPGAIVKLDEQAATFERLGMSGLVEEVNELKELAVAGDLEGLQRAVDQHIKVAQQFKLIKSPGDAVGGATGALIDRLIDEDDTLTVSGALGLIKGGAGQLSKQEAKAGTDAIASEAELAGKKKEAEERATQQTQLEFIVPKAVEGRKGELAAGANKAAAVFNAAAAKFNRLDAQMAAASDSVGFWTAGLIGTALKDLPGTPALNLKAQISTIVANLGFDELKAMKEASPTGGALGQITERELAFLQAVVANLEQSQSPEQLAENMEIVRKSAKQSWERVRQAYEKDYGKLADVGSSTDEIIDFSELPE